MRYSLPAVTQYIDLPADTVSRRERNMLDRRENKRVCIRSSSEVSSKNVFSNQQLVIKISNFAISWEKCRLQSSNITAHGMAATNNRDRILPNCQYVVSTARRRARKDAHGVLGCIGEISRLESPHDKRVILRRIRTIVVDD